MITQQLLDEVAQEVVPAAYQVNKQAGPVGMLRCAPRQELAEVRESLFGKPTAPGLFLGGLALNMHEFWLQRTGKDLPRWRGVHWVLLSETIQDREELAFILLHEIGHIDWWLKCEQSGKDAPEHFSATEAELYADVFAFEQLEKVWGMEKALALLASYACADELEREQQ